MIINLLLSISAVLCSVTEPQSISLRDAHKQNLISYTADYSPGSTHYSTPVRLTVNNTSGRDIRITIPAGYHFFPTDTNVQPQLVVKEELLALKPGEQKRIALHAMCTNASKSGPGNGVVYKLNNETKAPLREIAMAIDKGGYYGFEGQSAVWCFTNNNRIAEISGADTSGVTVLRKLLSAITGRPMPTKEELAGYSSNYYAPVQNPKVRMAGKYEMEFASTKNVAIAMFNRNNVVVRELFRNKETPAGKHVVEYEFDNTVYTEDYYRILMIVDGKVWMKRELDMKKYKRS